MRIIEPMEIGAMYRCRLRKVKAKQFRRETGTMLQRMMRYLLVCVTA